MSHVDVGKDAKHAGRVHPKNAPLTADKPTPKATKKRKPDKPFGFTYESRFCRTKWKQARRWFTKEAHRDQAFEKEAKSHAAWGPDHSLIAYRNLRKVSR